jgi:hypothetical protein
MWLKSSVAWKKLKRDHPRFLWSWSESRSTASPVVPCVQYGLYPISLANTYHELADPGAILDQIFLSLVPDGRVVIVEPMRIEHGELSPELIEEELRLHRFDIVSREERFVDQPGRGVWWLIAARKP